jgi:hypothetical protein
MINIAVLSIGAPAKVVARKLLARRLNAVDHKAIDRARARMC